MRLAPRGPFGGSNAADRPGPPEGDLVAASLFVTISASIVLGLAACSSKTPTPDAAPTATATATTTTSAADAATPEPSPDALASADDAQVEEVVDERTARLEALTRLDVPGFTRSRGALQRDLVTLAFDTAANAKGNVGAIELTVAVCQPCATTTVAELEGRKDMILQQLGELHAKNPGLVFSVNELELAPERKGAATYARSYVDDGTTRASVHTLEVQFADNGYAFRFQAYPRSGFPTSAEELASAFTQDELEAAVKRVFVAASAVLWPPSRPE